MNIKAKNLLLECVHCNSIRACSHSCKKTLNSARPRGEKGVVRFSRQSEGVMASKRKQKRVRNDYEEDLGPAKPKKVPKTLTEKDSEKRLIVILENACLETIKVHIHAAIGDPFNILHNVSCV